MSDRAKQAPRPASRSEAREAEASHNRESKVEDNTERLEQRTPVSQPQNNGYSGGFVIAVALAAAVIGVYVAVTIFRARAAKQEAQFKANK